MIGRFHGQQHSPRKRGPGRYNRLRAYSRGTAHEMRKSGYPNGIESSAHWDESGHAKQLAPALSGGNWQGKGYLSLSEADALARQVLALRTDQYDQVLTRKHIRRDWENNAKWLKTQPPSPKASPKET